jgi:hypothetical protein
MPLLIPFLLSMTENRAIIDRSPVGVKAEWRREKP